MESTPLGNAMGDLGKRLARGEVAAFAELYDLCADRLHHYLVSQLGSRHDAEEVLQETFLRLVRGREKLAGVESIAGYSFMIARNEALRRLAERSNENRRRAGARTSWERYHQFLRDLAATTASFKL